MEISHTLTHRTVVQSPQRAAANQFGPLWYRTRKSLDSNFKFTRSGVMPVARKLKFVDFRNRPKKKVNERGEAPMSGAIDLRRRTKALETFLVSARPLGRF